MEQLTQIAKSLELTPDVFTIFTIFVVFYFLSSSLFLNRILKTLVAREESTVKKDESIDEMKQEYEQIKEKYESELAESQRKLLEHSIEQKEAYRTSKESEVAKKENELEETIKAESDRYSNALGDTRDKVFQESESLALQLLKKIQ